jgi:hypothetical protein
MQALFRSKASHVPATPSASRMPLAVAGMSTSPPVEHTSTSRRSAAGSTPACASAARTTPTPSSTVVRSGSTQ